MSMTREQMLHYLGNPDQLNEKNLVELKEILDEYPYFQSAHLLYIKNLSNEKNFRFASQLKVSAIHATDRTVLYHLLNTQKKKPGEKEIKVGETINTSTEPQPAVVERKNSETSLIESAYRLDGEIEAGKTLGQLVKDINESAVRNKPDLFQNLIKQNLEEDFFSDEENAEIDNNDEFITETLAKIYIKQGLYGKAIDAFQRLKLKYPEKSIYFAKQIDEVTNLLNK
jgi:hypothetical protein